MATHLYSIPTRHETDATGKTPEDAREGGCDGFIPIFFFSVKESIILRVPHIFERNSRLLQDFFSVCNEQHPFIFCRIKCSKVCLSDSVAAYTSPFAAPSMRLSCNAYSASICAPRGRYNIRTFSAFLSSPSSVASYFARSLDTAGFFHALEYRFNSSSSIMIEWFRNRSSNVA